MTRHADLLVQGVTVVVIESEGAREGYHNLPHPMLVIPSGSEERQAHAVFRFLYARAHQISQPAYAAHTLFGLMRDNPAWWTFIQAAEAPEHVYLPTPTPPAALS